MAIIVPMSQQEVFQASAEKQFAELEKAWEVLKFSVFSAVLGLHRSVLSLRGFQKRYSKLDDIMTDSGKNFDKLHQDIIDEFPDMLPKKEIDFFKDFFSLLCRSDFNENLFSDLLKLLDSKGYRKLSLTDLKSLTMKETVESRDYKNFENLYLFLAVDFKRAYFSSKVRRARHGQRMKLEDFLKLYFEETKRFVEASADLAPYVLAANNCTGYSLAKVPQKRKNSNNSKSKVKINEDDTRIFVDKHLEILTMSKDSLSDIVPDLMKILKLGERRTKYYLEEEIERRKGNNADISQ